MNNMPFEFEVQFNKKDLIFGKCRCCGESSDEIIRQDGRCIDCFTEEQFELQTQKKRK